MIGTRFIDNVEVNYGYTREEPVVFFDSPVYFRHIPLHGISVERIKMYIIIFNIRPRARARATVLCKSHGAPHAVFRASRKSALRQREKSVK